MGLENDLRSGRPHTRQVAMHSLAVGPRASINARRGETGWLWSIRVLHQTSSTQYLPAGTCVSWLMRCTPAPCAPKPQGVRNASRDGGVSSSPLLVRSATVASVCGAACSHTSAHREADRRDGFGVKGNSAPESSQRISWPAGGLSKHIHAVSQLLCGRVGNTRRLILPPQRRTKPSAT